METFRNRMFCWNHMVAVLIVILKKSFIESRVYFYVVDLLQDLMALPSLYDKESLLSKILSFQNWQQQTFWTCIFSQGINRFFLFITVECVELWKCCEKKVVENVFGRKKKTSYRGLLIRLTFSTKLIKYMDQIRPCSSTTGNNYSQL